MAGVRGLQIGRREAVAAAIAVVLVVAAFVVPHLHLGIVTPLINATPARFRDFAGTAPIFGWWNAHVGWGTVPAILIGVAAVLWGPTLAQRLPWRALTLDHLGDVMRLGVLAGDDRRLAARLRRPAHRPSRIPAPGADHHRHPRGAQQLLAAGSSTTSPIRGSPMCPGIRRAHC